MNVKQLALQALRRLPCLVSPENGTFSRENTQFLAWLPLVPGSLKGLIGEYHVNDDGNGNIFTQWPQLVMRIGTINYLTGEMVLFLQPAAMPYMLDYCFAPNPPGISICEMKIRSSPIVARPRRISFPID